MSLSELYVILTVSVLGLSVGILFWKIYKAVKEAA